MFTLPELQYAHNALEPYIDEETMKIHHGKHHAGYVNNLNDALKDQPELLKMPIEELMKNLNKVPETIRTKVRNNGGGHANHSMFWKIMNPEKTTPSDMLARAISHSFGSIDSFKEAFTKAAVGRFGSGWAWLVVDKEKLSITDTPNQDNPWIENKIPILCLDVWEHAYYLKYKNMRADYVKAWWNVVNWKEASQRFEQAVQ